MSDLIETRGLSILEYNREIDRLEAEIAKLETFVDAAKKWRDENEWPMYYDCALLTALAELEGEGE